MLRFLIALVITMASQIAVAAPEVLVDVDMTKPGPKVSEVDPAHTKSITGQLPAGVGENSGWQDDIDLKYALASAGGRAFWQIKTTRGSAQLQIPLGEAYRQDAFYRLKITTRSADDATMELQLRMQGAPYDVYWKSTTAPAETWNEKEFTFRIAKQTKPYALFLIAKPKATIEISGLTLQRESRDDLIAGIKARYPDGNEKRNRVNVSRFPLGIQSGWGLDRDLTDEQFTIAADPSVPGPSGCPSLKLQGPADKAMNVSPPPFDLPWSFQKHTLSLAVRGQGTLGLRVFSGASMWDENGVANRTVTLEDRWQRVSITFDPVFMEELHQLRLIVRGSAWIDGLQLMPGTESGEYSSRLPYEVALAFPQSRASAARVQFEDEPAILDYAVTGKGEKRAVLAAKVINAYGEERKLQSQPLGGEFVQKGQIRYDAFPDSPFGPFRVEAWVEDGSGKHIGSPNEAIVLRLRRPRHWGEDAPQSPFGTHFSSLTRHITMAKAIGMNWVRLHDAGTQYTGWSHLEPEQGKWAFADADIKRYRDGKINILGMLSTAPGWATSLGRPATGYFDRWVIPNDNVQFGNYVSTVVGRYKGTIDDWEIWNEPWGSGFWAEWDKATNKQARPADASQRFAALSKVAYASAKAANPQSTICGINTYGSSDGRKWTADLLKEGAAAACDVYSYHQYNSEFTGFPGDAAQRAYTDAFSAILEARGGHLDKPVWMSEGNAHDGQLGRGMYFLSAPGKYQDDVIRLSDNLCRFSVRMMSMGVDKFFYYTMHHNGIFRRGASPWSACTTDDGFLHPSAGAFSAMAWELEDTKFVKTVEVSRGVYAHLFAGKGRSVAAFTGEAKHDKYVLPGTPAISARNLFGNPLPPGSAFTGNVIYVEAAGDADSLARALQSK